MQKRMLHDSVVQTARQRFEANRNQQGPLCRLGFEELFRVFGEDCNSYTALAEQAGVSREAVRYIYNKYFRELVPGRKSGRERQRVCTLERAVHASYDILLGSRLRPVVEQAQKEGYAVLPIRVRQGSSS